MNTPLIMGVLNTTPDSFSDAGHYFESDAAISRGLQLLDQGADILDIGGESTRPGSLPVPVDEELRRTVPVIQGLLQERPDTLISIDTCKARVAQAAVEAGARMINDISAATFDPDILQVAASSSAHLVLSHIQGTPRDMQQNPVYQDVLTEVRDHLAHQRQAAIQAGVPPEHIILDPGIGFGKTTEHNLLLIKHLDRLRIEGCQLLLGTSRKSWIGNLLQVPADQRLVGSLAAIAACLPHPDIVRVHDVLETRHLLTIFNAIHGAQNH